MRKLGRANKSQKQNLEQSSSKQSDKTIVLRQQLTELEMKNKKLLHAIQETKDFYENMIALMPGHIYWLDKNGVYLGCNDQQAKNAKLDSREKIVGKTNQDMIWKDQAKQLDAQNENVMRTGKIQISEEYAVMADGPGYYLSQKVPLRNKAGKITGVLGVSLNITELKKTRDALEAAHRSKSEFLSTVSHEIRDPIGAAISLQDMLKEQVDRLQVLIENLLLKIPQAVKL